MKRRNNVACGGERRNGGENGNVVKMAAMA